MKHGFSTFHFRQFSGELLITEVEGRGISTRRGTDMKTIIHKQNKMHFVPELHRHYLRKRAFDKDARLRTINLDGPSKERI